MRHEEEKECKETAQPASEQSDGSKGTTNPLKNGGPRGVFRFRTFEEFNEWKDRLEREKAPKILHNNPAKAVGA